MTRDTRSGRTCVRRLLIRSCLGAFAAALFLAAGCGRDNGPEKEEPVASATNVPARATIVFLGDSLTAGRGLPIELAMPSLVQRQIENTGLAVRVVNAGRSGDTTAGGLARLPYYLRRENNVRMLVIGLGSNDAMRGQPIPSMVANLSSIVRQTRKFDAKIQIALFQMHTFPNMGRTYAGSYERMFREVARKERITLLPFPLKGVAGVPALNQPDGIHPTERGTEIFAGNVWRSLEPHVRLMMR